MIVGYDYERLRDDLSQEGCGAFFVGGYGGGLMEALDAELARSQDLLELARQQGVDLEDYETDDDWE